MMQIEHIFLDMDGVLVDFVTAALKVHGTNIEQLDWPPSEWSVPKILGMSSSEFWGKIDAQGSGFWSGLTPYSWYRELIELVSSIAPFSILTSPSLSPSCSKGKVQWLMNHMPQKAGRAFREYLIGSEKHLLAQPGRILIDDSQTNIEKFRASGGIGIEFPRTWNRNHTAADDPMRYVRRTLRELTVDNIRGQRP